MTYTTVVTMNRGKQKMKRKMQALTASVISSRHATLNAAVPLS